MRGFVDVATDTGVVIAVLIPLICYVVGGSLLIGSFYGFWQLANPARTLQNRWLPVAGLFTSAALLSYDRILNFANNSFGGGVTSSLAPLTSYSAPTLDPATQAGATPGEWFINVLTAFQFFFRAFGALMVLLGLLELYRRSKGDRTGGFSWPVVQMVGGIGSIGGGRVP